VRIYPAPGNHEYEDTDPTDQPCTLTVTTGGGQTRSACGYDRYFTEILGEQFIDGDGYGDFVKKFNGSAPHPILFVSLNVTQCDIQGSLCQPGGAVHQFLTQTLTDPATNPESGCVVVYYHEPRWSDYHVGDRPFVDPIWRAMFSPGGNVNLQPDLVLNGHAHNYQRFGPLDADGNPSPDGIPEIIVGTGGASLHGGPMPGGPAPLVHDTTHFGALQLNWSPSKGKIKTAFFAEDGTRLDPSSGFVPYTCHAPTA
jgi:hypothetical protein